MAKLIKILAASVGGGLVLGAGIRLGEAIAAQDPVARSGAGQKLAERVGALETRLLNLEVQSPGPVAAAAVNSSTEMPTRSQLNLAKGQTEALGEISMRLRGELRGWLEESVGTRMAEVETRLRVESERSQKKLLDAFVESVQTRVIQRISSLEEEVAGQSAAMTELRECSLRTEQSMQKLLGGIDRLILKAPAAEPAPAREPAGSESSASEVVPPASQERPPAVTEPAPRSRRWSLFG